MGSDDCFFIAVIFIGFLYSNNSDFIALWKGGDWTGSFKSYLLYASGQIFLEHPILGIGLGNWHLAAYQFDFSNISEFNNPLDFIRYRSHNLYASHLVELGIIGFLAFVYPLGKVMTKGWRYSNSLSLFQKAAYASLLVYLFTSFFYCTVNSYEYHFSSMQLLAFCALGILTKSWERHFKLPAWGYPLFFGVIALLLGLVVYSKMGYDSYRKAKAALSKKEVKEAIQQLESIYHPAFKISHDYQTSLPHLLAEQYQLLGENDRANQYYQEALKYSPNHEPLLLSYANFLFYKLRKPKEALEYVNKILSIQGNHQATLDLYYAIHAYISKLK